MSREPAGARAVEGALDPIARTGGPGSRLVARVLAPVRGLGPASAAGALLAVVALVALTRGAAEIPAEVVLRILLDSLPLIEVDVNAPLTW